MALTPDPTDPDSNSASAAPSNPYVLHPYQGDIFPGTSAGAKLFDRATTGPDEDKRLSLNLDDAIEIKARVLKAQQDYAWSSLTAIPKRYASDGTPHDFEDLVSNPESVELADVQAHAGLTWARPNVNLAVRTCTSMEVVKIDPGKNENDRPDFQRRVRSQMISSWIRNNFTEEALDSIELQAAKFKWSVPLADGGGKRLDGPTMLKVILDTISPSLVVGTDNLRKSIQNTRLPKFKYDVVMGLESMERDYNEIRRRKETYDSMRLHVFDCLKSAKNTRFLRWVDRVEEDIRSNTGEYKGFDAAMVISAAKTQYRNMMEDKTWDKVDPANAQMLALLTALTTAAKSTTANNASNGGGNGNGGGGGGGGNGGTKGGSHSQGRPFTYEEWQTNKTTDSIVKNGRTWWWCPNHNEGKGLYVRHPPQDHDKWKAAVKNKKKTGGRLAYVSPDPLTNGGSAHTVDGGSPTKKQKTDDSDTGNLELADSLKHVLASMGMSNSDCNDAIEQAQGMMSSKG